MDMGKILENHSYVKCNPGFFNILPIPALDGGYVLFLLIESITGKKFSDKFMEVVTTAGFLILITLMLLAIGLDINRFFR